MASDPVAAQRRVLEIAEALEGVPGLVFNGVDLREFGGGSAGVDVDLWVREEFDGLGDGRGHDVDDRAATVQVTVNGEEHSDVVRECERFPELPDGIEVYVERIEAHDVQDEQLREERDELQEEIDFLEDQLDDVRETLDERNEQLDEARRRAQRAEDELEDADDGDRGTAYSTSTCNGEDLDQLQAALEERAEERRETLDEPDQEDGLPFDPMGKTTGDIEDRVAEIDDPESLRLLRESERTGSHRSSVAEAINSRIDELEDGGQEDVGQSDGADEPDQEDAPEDDAGEGDGSDCDSEAGGADEPLDELTDAERATLEALQDAGEVGGDALTDRVDYKRASVTNYLGALRAEGLVESRADPDDGRRSLYQATVEDQAAEEDVVYVATGIGNSGEDKCYHEDEECQAIAQANNVHEKPRDSVPHHGPCGMCAIDDEVLVCGNGGTTYHRSEDCPTIENAKNVYRKDLEEIEGYHPCGQCAAEEFEEDDDPDPDDVEIPAECEWLGRPADVIVEDSSVERNLEEVLDVVDRADGWLQVHKRIAGNNTSTTKDLLWELGLREQSGALHEDDVLEERIAALRRCYLS